MGRRSALAWAIISFSAAVALPLAAQETTSYTYDALGRFVVSTTSGGPQDGVSKTLGYDPSGNRTTYVVAAPSNTATFSVVAPAATVNAGLPATFTVTKSNAITGVSTVQYATQDGSAHSPTDYTGTSGTLTFQPADTTKSVTVSTAALSAPQPSKQFSLVITNPIGGPTIATGSAQATINAVVSGGGSPPVTVTQRVTLGVCDDTFVDVQDGGDYDPGGNYPLTVTSAVVSGGANIINTRVDYGTRIEVGSQGNITGSGQVTYTIKNSVGASATGYLAVTVVNKGGCN